MGETRPVRLEDIKPNSHKYKEETLKKAQEEETEKVNEPTTVTLHKRSFARRFTDSFFDGDFKTAVDYAFSDILFPAFKRGIADMFQNLIEMMLFGTTRKGHSSNPLKGDKERVSYNTFYKSDLGDNRRDDFDDRHPRYDYRDLEFDSYGEADEKLDILRGIIESEYGQATIADLYDAAGVTKLIGEWTDNTYGWKDLKNAKPRYIPRRNKYVLDLPRPIQLD